MRHVVLRLVVGLVLSCSLVAGAAAGYGKTGIAYATLAAPLAVLLAAILLRYPLANLIAYVLIIPLENFGVLPMQGLTVIKVVSLGGVLAVAASAALTRRRMRIPPFVLPAVLLYSAYLASWWFGGQSDFGRQLLVTLLLTCATTAVLSETVNSEGDLRPVLMAFALSCAVYAIVSATYALRTDLLHSDNMRSINDLRGNFPLADPNYVALYLNFGVLASISLLLSSDTGVRKWIYAVTLALTVFGVITTLSRMGIAAMTICASVLILGASRRRTRWLLIAVSAAILVGLAIVLGGESLASRVSVMDSDISVAGRLWAWYAGLRMFQDYPILGIGLGQFARMFATYRPADSYFIDQMVAHNSWIEILAETGLVGLTAWASLMFGALKQALSRATIESVGCKPWVKWFICSGLLLLLVFSLTTNIHFNKTLWLFVALSDRIFAASKESVSNTHASPTPAQ